jgi:hypothetical protein
VAFGTPVAGAAEYSASGGTTVAPAYPSGILATDAVLLFVGQKPSTANGGTVTTPTGWTLREEITGAGGYGATLGADTGNTNLRVYSWNTPVAGQTGTQSVTLGVNNVSWAFIVRVPTSGGTLSYGSADGQRTTTPTSPMSIALTNGASATAFTTGDIAVWAMCIPTDVTTPSQFSSQSITATGATFATAVEINEPDSNTGNDIGGYSAYALVSSGTSSTAPTVAVSLAGTLTNVRGGVGLVRIREAVVIRTGSLAATETGSDTFTSSGKVIVKGSLSASETGTDTLSATGKVIVQGSLSVVETGTDSFSASGKVIVQGSLQATEVGLDTAAFTGVVTSSSITGTMAANEEGLDIANFDGRQTQEKSVGGGGLIKMTASRRDLISAAEKMLRLLQKPIIKNTLKITKVTKKLEEVTEQARPRTTTLETLAEQAITELVNQQKLIKNVEDARKIRVIIQELKEIKNYVEDEEEAIMMLFG